jgi:gamma-glutamyl hercynylcysteine S-oxide synthase
VLSEAKAKEANMRSDQSAAPHGAAKSGTASPQGSAWNKLQGWLGSAVWQRLGGVDEHSLEAAREVSRSEHAAIDEISALEPAHVLAEEHTLVDELLAHGRYALLLRPRLIANLTLDQFQRAEQLLNEGMCLVPEGEVVVHRNIENEGDDEPSPLANQLTRVEGYYLDRYPVTNEQFQHFVESGGYEQMAIWDPEIWPAVLDFVDRTGAPGPRPWRNGKFLRGEGNFPVVGVSWYEASAYARWAGKRLPTDAEWVKAASWPVAIPGHPLLQRRFPWGEAIDRERANLWGSGPGKIVAVDQFPGGVSVGGAQQMIGNVWEWMVDLFTEGDVPPGGNSTHPRMHSVRGGAYDTYLDCQSTCNFQSADHALARKHNVGFRCAIGMCDIAQRHPASEENANTPHEDSLLEARA